MMPAAIGYVVFFLAHIAFAKRNAVPVKPDRLSRNYNISLTDLRHTYLNANYFGPSTGAELHDPNEFSFRWEILKMLPANTKSIVYSFEKNNRDEYVPSITVRETLCGEFRKQQQHMPLYSCTRHQEAGFKECPFEKGVYIATHVRCSSADGPIMAPGHFWRLNKTWITDNNVLLSATNVEFTVHHKSSHTSL